MTGLSSAIARAAVVTRIDLTQLWVDGDPSAGPRQISGVQARDSLQERVVVEYLDAILDEEPLPPIRVLVDAEGVHRVVDGWHRLEAHRRASRLQIDAVVEEGDERAAILEAAGANAAHGLQRSAADKRRAVRLLLADPEWSTWSDRAIGQRCRVHHSFVGSIRRELAEETGAVASAERRGRDGRVIDTSRIGRQKAAAEETEAESTPVVAAVEEEPPRVGLMLGITQAWHDPDDLRLPVVSAGEALRVGIRSDRGSEEQPIVIPPHLVVRWRGRAWLNTAGLVYGPYQQAHLTLLVPAAEWSPGTSRPKDREHWLWGAHVAIDLGSRFVLDPRYSVRITQGVHPPPAHDRAAYELEGFGIPTLTLEEWKRYQADLAWRAQVDQGGWPFVVSERSKAAPVVTPVVGAEAEALEEEGDDREDIDRWEADMDRRIADGSFETGIAGVAGDEVAEEGQDGDEDLDDRSSADAEVVTEARLETAILPSSAVPRADDVTVITVWEPPDLLPHQLPTSDLMALSRSTPEERRKLGRKHLLSWRGRQWVRSDGHFHGPFEAFELVAIVPEEGAQLPPLAGEGEPGLGYYHQVRVWVSGSPRGRTGERVPYLLDARHQAHVAYGVRRHGDFVHRRWHATTPELTLEETRTWDLGLGAEERLEVVEAAKIRHLAATLPTVTAPPAPPDEAPPLPDADRAPFDAYYTPEGTAIACLSYLLDDLGIPDDATVVEPSVGGGAWVRAVRALLPQAIVDRCDVNPEAPGLRAELRREERAIVGDWLDPIPPRRGQQGEQQWELCLGNPPYVIDTVLRFVERCLERAPIVALLLRETLLGTEPRLPWWSEHRPAWVVKVVPRPKWEGPGARPTSDFSDTLLVVWVRGNTETRFDWLDVPARLRELDMGADTDGAEE